MRPLGMPVGILLITLIQVSNTVAVYDDIICPGSGTARMKGRGREQCVYIAVCLFM